MRRIRNDGVSIGCRGSFFFLQKRPSVLEYNGHVLQVSCKNQFCEIYGSRSVIPLIESILNIDINEQIYN